HSVEDLIEAIHQAHKTAGRTWDAAAYTIQRIVSSYKPSRSKFSFRGLGLDGAEQALKEVEGSAFFWNSPRLDAAFSRRNGDRPSNVILSPLWIEDVRRGESSRLNCPSWARSSWSSFKRSKQSKSAKFEIWIRWYESLLAGEQEGFFKKALTGPAEDEIIS